MSTPYTAVTITGYNLQAPPDDGSNVASNALKWSNHIDKIGDPIKALAEGINTNVAAAFEKIFGANIKTRSLDYTIVAADQGWFIEVDAAATITLLPVATASENFALAIVNTSSGIVTVDGDGSETINGLTTIALAPGAALVITCNGAKWIGFSSAAISPHKVKAADESVTSSTSAQVDDELAGLALVTGKWHRLEGFLNYRQDGGDIKIVFAYSDTPQAASEFSLIATDSGVAVAGETGSASSPLSITTLADASASSIRIRGAILANAVDGGTMELWWAQDSSNANPTTIKAGSWLSVIPID